LISHFYRQIKRLAVLSDAKRVELSIERELSKTPKSRLAAEAKAEFTNSK
jgi:hypothetical protein